MTNERDVRWLDEVGLHSAVVSGDREAFCELMRRFDPIVRAHAARGTEEVTEAVADFWCGLLDDPTLLAWQPERGGLLAQWISVLAAARLLRKRAA